jgi:hypothetical protein
MRFSLMANLLNMLPSLLITTTLIWEPAAIFYDLLMAVLESLMPLTVFIGIIFVTFIFIFYTIGQHQLTFDFYTDYNLDDMAGGIIREYVDGMEPGQDRYEDILGNMYEDEELDIEYRGIAKTFVYVYQMLLGDASHDGFLAFKQTALGSYTYLVLYIIYLIASLMIVLVLANIIIAVMGEVQSMRTDKGRDIVVYATQMKVVIAQYSTYNQMIT